VSQTVDIRRPVGIEMEYEVLKAGHMLVPNFLFRNEEGVVLFVALDQDQEWLKTPRPVGNFRSVAWIPGNFLAEGTVIVNIAITTLDPFIIHYHERDAVAFQVIDTIDGDSARREYGGGLPGVIRPMLKWTTEYKPGMVERKYQE
jgi:lipopolysaccharide transport system ATP-binding protein